MYPTRILILNQNPPCDCDAAASLDESDTDYSDEESEFGEREVHNTDLGPINVTTPVVASNDPPTSASPQVFHL
jgi:hypothetical protein